MPLSTEGIPHQKVLDNLSLGQQYVAAALHAIDSDDPNELLAPTEIWSVKRAIRKNKNLGYRQKKKIIGGSSGLARSPLSARILPACLAESEPPDAALHDWPEDRALCRDIPS